MRGGSGAIVCGVGREGEDGGGGGWIRNRKGEVGRNFCSKINSTMIFDFPFSQEPFDAADSVLTPDSVKVKCAMFQSRLACPKLQFCV